MVIRRELSHGRHTLRLKRSKVAGHRRLYIRLRTENKRTVWKRRHPAAMTAALRELTEPLGILWKSWSPIQTCRHSCACVAVACASKEHSGGILP